MIKNIFTYTGMVREGQSKKDLYWDHHFMMIEQILQDYEDQDIDLVTDLSPHIYETHVFGWFYEVTRGAFDANHLFFRDLRHAKYAKAFVDKLELIELSQALKGFLSELDKLLTEEVESLLYHDLHSNPERYSQLYFSLTKLDQLISNDVEKGDFRNYSHGQYLNSQKITQKNMPYRGIRRKRVSKKTFA